jgi:hypothetical protein
MTNVQGNQAPAKRQKMLKKFENSSTKTVAEQSMSSQTPLERFFFDQSANFPITVVRNKVNVIASV